MPAWRFAFRSAWRFRGQVRHHHGVRERRRRRQRRPLQDIVVLKRPDVVEIASAVDAAAEQEGARAHTGQAHGVALFRPRLLRPWTVVRRAWHENGRTRGALVAWWHRQRHSDEELGFVELQGGGGSHVTAGARAAKD
eukprot:scaffold12953_cov96-Isochrysis_galbana.AAC.3